MPETEVRIENLLFAELALETSRPFDGLAIGKFTTMYGDDIEITVENLAEMVKNTKKVIKSTESESGEIVGLPIDTQNHDHEGGAGWIVDVKLSEDGKKILFTPQWTDVGEDLIRRSLRRFFSATFSLEMNVIYGGSLTNWPASKDALGRMALRPIELSEYLKEIAMPDEIETTVIEPEVTTPEGEPNMPNTQELETQPSETIQELLRTPEAIVELGKRAQKMAEEKIAAEKRQTQVVEFASKLVGGSAEHPVGLAIRADEIVSLLLSLPEQQSKAVQSLLTKSLSAAINYAEMGFEGGNYLAKPRLSGFNLEQAQKWVKAGRKIEEFFTVNPEVGNAEDFNLSEFVKKEN